MVWAEGFFVNGEGAAEERFGGCEIAPGFQQSSKIIEICGHIRMVWAESFFVDGEGASEKRFNGCEIPLG